MSFDVARFRRRRNREEYVGKLQGGPADVGRRRWEEVAAKWIVARYESGMMVVLNLFTPAVRSRLWFPAQGNKAYYLRSGSFLADSNASTTSSSIACLE